MSDRTDLDSIRKLAEATLWHANRGTLHGEDAAIVHNRTAAPELARFALLAATGYFVIDQACHNCGNDPVLHGPYETHEQATTSSQQLTGSCVQRFILALGGVP